MTFNVGDKVVIVKDFDTKPYGASCSGICDTERVGLCGVVSNYDAPAGKTPVEFFAGDLGYNVDGTREEPEYDDLLTLYIPTDSLALR